MSTDTETAAAEALQALEPIRDQVDPGPLEALKALASDEDGVAKSLDTLQKAEEATSPDAHEIRKAVRAARERVEKAYLEEVSPGAVARFEAHREAEAAIQDSNLGRR